MHLLLVVGIIIACYCGGCFIYGLVSELVRPTKETDQ